MWDCFGFRWRCGTVSGLGGDAGLLINGYGVRWRCGTVFFELEDFYYYDKSTKTLYKIFT